jgi:hypothetical protein
MSHISIVGCKISQTMVIDANEELEILELEDVRDANALHGIM